MVDVRIIPATLEHVRVMARTMRAEEVREARECGHEPRHLIHERYRMSEVKRAAIVDGAVAAIWGVQASAMGFDAEGWLFTSPAIERIPLTFFREARRQVAELLEMRSPIRASVGAFHAKSARFWQIVGADVAPEAPVWPTGKAFHEVTLRKPANGSPFVILALPRSRTAWLAQFLSYGQYQCAHEQARHMRSVADVRAWLSQDFTGTAETAAAPWWRLIRHLRPDCRVVIVRRPVNDVVESLLALDLGGVEAFKRETLTAEMQRLDRKLDQIERRMPGVLSVRFDDLNREAVCARVFEHCLGYQHDAAWWAECAPVNVQVSMPALMRYCAAYRPALERVAVEARQQTLTMIRRAHAVPLPERDDVTIAEETLADVWRDGQALFKEHAAEVGPRPGVTLNPNLPVIQKLEDIGALQIVTARSNGRLFGYLATIISPSLEDSDLTVATQTTFFVSKDFRGLGPRLQVASINRLRERGVGELIMRAGVRGSGAKMAALCRRLGAEDYGQLFSMMLEAA